MVCLCLFSDSMAPKTKCVAKKAIGMRLVDESSGDEQSGGLNEVHNVRIDPKAQVPQTRATVARAAQTQVQKVSSSHSNKKGYGDGSNKSSP